TGVAERDVAAFIAELNQAFPALDLTFADVTLVHHGVVPASVDGTRVSLQGREQIRDHAADGVEGLLTVAGAKFTTARAGAEKGPTLTRRRPHPAAAAGRPASVPRPGGSVRDVGLATADARREHDEGLPADTIPHLVAAYGSRYRDVMDVAGDRVDLR